MQPQPILPPQERPQRRRRKSWLLGFLGFAFTAGVIMFVAVSAVAGYFIWQAGQDLPSYEKLATYEPPVMTRIHAHDGQLIAEYARERRIFVPINTIPKVVLGAFLSAEDSRFYEHGGLDSTLSVASFRSASRATSWSDQMRGFRTVR
ncbi:MAG: transglycosylase domain-containing protein [Pseudomonadota bacterium]